MRPIFCRKFISLGLTLLVLWGCGSTAAQPEAAPSTNSAPPQIQTTLIPAAPAESVEPGDPTSFLDAVFHPEAAEGTDQIQIDMSACNLGYVAVSAHSDRRLKFQVLFEDVTYTYDIQSDGTPSIFPLQSGDGEYTFRVMENVEGTKYAQSLRLSKAVTLDSAFEPFLRPNDYSRYTRDSECVQEALRLTSAAQSQLDIVTAIYTFISQSIRYDYDKAATVKSGYLPNVDEVLYLRKGICFDYASLSAAMLRSQGVPCKVIFGYVAPDQLYHAWNMFYTEETGWVTASFKVNSRDWTRIDLTFTANGQDDAFIGDGSNYTDLYYY